jgi:ribulose-5-phosphate 4-epimerase/fuculose-1-phosphate aldolase
MRINAGAEFLISGTQTGHLSELGPGHFALVTKVDLARNRLSCRGTIQASSESMTHAALYEIDPSIKAVVHVHSKPLWTALHNRMPTTSDDIPYGTPEMAREFTRLHRESQFRNIGVAVMGGHAEGLVSIGETMAEAATRMLDLHDTLQSA